MIKSKVLISVIFNDDTKVHLTGDIDKIVELLRGHDIKGFEAEELFGSPESKWDIKVLDKLLNKERE